MKQTEIGLIPEDWEVVNFNDEFNFLSTASYSRAEIQSQGEIGYIHYGDIHTKLNFHLDLNDYVSGYIKPEQIKTYSNIEVGDLIMADASEDYSGVGKAVEIIGKKNNIKVISGLHTFLIRAKKENRFALGFKGYFQNNPLIKKQYDALATGLKVYSLSKNSFKNIQIPLPPLGEQEAIANALSDADAWIEKLEQLIAKKRLIKQGAMQTLLTPPDRTVSGVEPWEVKKLGEVLKLKGGYAFKSTNFIDYGIPVIRISDINGTSVELESSVYVDEDNIPKDFHAEFGDILIAMSGATTGKIGRYSYSYNSYINQRVGKFDIYDLSRHSIDYLYHLLFSKPFKDQLNKFLAQGAQPNVSGSQIEEIQLCFPKSLSEQERIATILSDMDAEIEALEQQLGKARHTKQGMMQELLTGRTRLV